MAISSSRWMSALPDQTPMTAVSTPGTHDACCHSLTGVAAQLATSKWKPLFAAAAVVPAAGLLGLSAAEYVVRVLALTQTLNIRQQLEAGVRFFDLRPYFGAGQTLPIYHGIVRTTSTLPGVLSEITNHLRQHPSEYVVLRLKAEGDDLSRSARRNLLQQCLTPFSHFVSQQISKDTWQVSDVRGKMVLLLDGIDALPAPLHSERWDSASIQDEFEINANENFISAVSEGACNVVSTPVRSVLSFFGKETNNWCDGVGKTVPKIFVPDKVFDSKRVAIKKHHLASISRRQLSRFSLNFISCIGSGSDILFLSPQVCSTKFNPGVKKLISDNSSKEKTGIVVMDFISEDLAKGIYLANPLKT